MISLRCGGSGSSGNCYSLTDESGKILLLDAGIPLPEIKKLVNWNVTAISSCFTSHEHLDHVKSADKLRNMGIQMFQPYKGGRQRFAKDGWKLSAFPLNHDGVENRGIYGIAPDGHRFLYMTDFSHCKFVFANQKVNTVIIECNYVNYEEDDNVVKRNHVFRGHASLDVCTEFLKVNKTDGLENVILCHLSDGNSNEEEMLTKVKDVVGDDVNVYVAKKGLVVNL